MTEVKPRRWPAIMTAVAFLGYAAGKAVQASQEKLGFPSGPVPSAADHHAYPRDVMDVAVAQWMAVATGLVATAIVIVTVAEWGQRVPRWVMWPVLSVLVLAVGAGGVTVAADAFIGFGVGWQWYHGVVATIVVGLTLATVWSYARAGRTRQSPRNDPAVPSVHRLRLFIRFGLFVDQTNRCIRRRGTLIACAHHDAWAIVR